MGSIVVQDISKVYLDAKGDPFYALKNVSLTWDKGQNISVIGESGSGKSTLARLLIGIEKPTSGQIIIGSENIGSWNYSRWRKERRRIQAVFQDASGTLNPVLSVYHNVEEALCNLTNLDKQQRKKRIHTLMELTNMSKKLLEVPTRQLSGGEQRRLSLLRALSIHPDYLVLDEVTSGLDLLSADAVLSVLEKYHKEFGCAYLLVTHEKQNAFRISDRIFEMQKGELIQVGNKVTRHIKQ